MSPSVNRRSSSIVDGMFFEHFKTCGLDVPLDEFEPRPLFLRTDHIRDVEGGEACCGGQLTRIWSKGNEFQMDSEGAFWISCRRHKLLVLCAPHFSKEWRFLSNSHPLLNYLSP